MKRFLLIPSLAFLAVSTLTSCQKEEKTALELTQELTAELQKISDYRTAEAAAPRVEVLNKRMQNAGVRAFAANDPALTRSMIDAEGSEGAAYSEALAQLAAEIGRIQASAPTGEDGEIDRTSLILAVGAANGSAPDAAAGDRQKAGMAYIKDTTSTHETPGTLPEYYGSDKLREALSYKADPTSVPLTKMDTDEDVPAIPAAVELEEEEVPTYTEEEPAADDSADEPATTDEPATADEEPSADDSSDEPSIDDEPAADDSSDEPSIDEEPSTDDSSDEPSLDDSSDEPSLDDSGSDDLDVGDDAGDDSGDDIEIGDLGL
ncbi:MAG: hypothetical protein IJ503_04115 [Akkermansia sp.]|nr:hypothetical protein [Akkermansia sp.]